MSLPEFSTQSCLFSTAALSARLFPETDRYRLFGKLVYPKLAEARTALEKCYCLENGRTAVVGIVTQPAYESDETGALQMEQEQAALGLDKPPVQSVDGAYVSAEKRVQAQAEGRELIGPAQPAPGATDPGIQAADETSQRDGRDAERINSGPRVAAGPVSGLTKS
jgi:hypothetical protein